MRIVIEIEITEADRGGYEYQVATRTEGRPNKQEGGPFVHPVSDVFGSGHSTREDAAWAAAFAMVENVLRINSNR